MNTVLETNSIRPDAVLTKDPGWIISEVGQEEATVFTENGNNRLALFQGQLLPRIVNPNNPLFTLGLDQVEFEVLNFTFNKPGNLKDCNALEVERIIIYGIPEADGVREKLVSGTNCLAADCVSNYITKQRKRFVTTTNILYAQINGIDHAIEVFPYRIVTWVTIEELLTILQNKFQTYLQTLDPLAFVDISIGTSGYIEFGWQTTLSVALNVSDLNPLDNIFKTLHNVFYIQNFQTNVVDPSKGFTNASVLQLYPTREGQSENSSLQGANLILFSSPELTQFMTNVNIVSTGSSEVCAIGVLETLGLNFQYYRGGGIWDFNKHAEANLISNKMRFHSERITDTFSLNLSIATRLDNKGQVAEAFEVALSKYLPHHKIRVIMIAKIY